VNKVATVIAENTSNPSLRYLSSIKNASAAVEMDKTDLLIILRNDAVNSIWLPENCALRYYPSVIGLLKKFIRVLLTWNYEIDWTSAAAKIKHKPIIKGSRMALPFTFFHQFLASVWITLYVIFVRIS